MALQEFSGNAVAATLGGTITSGATSCTISDGTGWPTGATAPFVATFDKGSATEEKVLCSTRSGTTLNFSTRGYDGTTPAAHSAGGPVIHSISAVVVAEANAHVNTTTRDDHTQYAKKASNLSDLSNVVTARANLGAQASDADLTAIAALVSTANKLPYATGTSTWSLADLTAFARTILDDGDAATVRATLGLLSMAIQAASAVAITGGTITGITDLAVADGGTGSSTQAGARTNLGLGALATKTTVLSGDLDSTLIGDFLNFDSATPSSPTTVTAVGNPPATPTEITGTTVTMASTRSTQQFLIWGAADVTYTSAGGGGNPAVTALSIDGSTSLTNPQMIGYMGTGGITVRVTLMQMWMVSGLAVASHTFRLKGFKVGAGDTVVVSQTHTRLNVLRIG